MKYSAAATLILDCKQLGDENINKETKNVTLYHMHNVADEMQICYFLIYILSGAINQITFDLRKMLFEKTNVNKLERK